MFVLSSAKIKPRLQEKLIKAYPQIDFQFHDSMESAKTSLPKAEILLTYGEDLSAELISIANQLKWINVISAGLEEMPLHVIKDKGILVTNARGIHKTPMAEYTMTMILQIARNTKQLIANEQAGIWDRKVKMKEIAQQTIGILGIGAIGTEIARLAKAFNMKVIGMNRSGQSVPYVDEIITLDTIDRLLTNSDFIVSVLPLTRETFHLLKEEHFIKMKRTATFINIGRGATIVERDLIRCLNKGYLHHAVLDVMEQEPLQKNHPFWEMEKITVTPHLSGISREYQDRAIDLFIQNINVFLSNKKNYINEIDLKRGY